MKLIYHLQFFFLIFGCIQAQPSLSPQSRISLLTIDPGAELYSAFGHTGIWVHDPLNGINTVYNYGTFDFVPGKETEFYLNFIKGRLIYRLDRESFKRFQYVYKYFKRTYFSQELNLSLDQRQEVYEFLLHNYQPEYRNYLYDFIYDNCATRVIELLNYVLEDSIIWEGEEEKSEMTIREMLRDPYLTGREWSGFGIDLILGSVVDQHPTKVKQAFLPDYLAAYFEEAKVVKPNGESLPLVRQKRSLYQGEPGPQPLPFYLKPIFFSLLLFFAIGGFTFYQWKNGKKGLWLDRILFGVSGLAGLILLLAWIATEHTSTAWNYNIVWLFPLHITATGFIRKNISPITGLYFIGTVALIMVAAICWIAGIQSMNPAFIPLMGSLTLRSLIIFQRSRTFESDGELQSDI